MPCVLYIAVFIKNGLVLNGLTEARVAVQPFRDPGPFEDQILTKHVNGC